MISGPDGLAGRLSISAGAPVALFAALLSFFRITVRAIYVLLFQLVEKISHCLRSRYLLPLVCGAAAIGLMLANLPGLYELIQFAIQTYPV